MLKLYRIKYDSDKLVTIHWFIGNTDNDKFYEITKEHAPGDVTTQDALHFLGEIQERFVMSCTEAFLLKWGAKQIPFANEDIPNEY